MTNITSQEITSLVYDIRHIEVGYITVELYKAFEGHILKLYSLKAKNYKTGEYVFIEKFYGNDVEAATERLCLFAENILGFTREQIRGQK